MAKPRTASKYKVLILIIVPISTLLLLSFSYIKEPISPIQSNVQVKETKDCILKIGQIIWKGNSVYNSKKLNEELGIKAGDIYDREELNKKLLNGTIQTLYFDNGFAYYKADVFEYNQNKSLIDITINVNEGVKCKIGEISVTGNKSVSSEAILKKVEIKSGDFFNKTKIHNSLVSINSIGKFDSDKINITPIPNAEKSSKNLAVLDLVFEVSEINK
jgi:outer membrane protein insertion porin family